MPSLCRATKVAVSVPKSAPPTISSSLQYVALSLSDKTKAKFKQCSKIVLNVAVGVVDAVQVMTVPSSNDFQRHIFDR